MLLTVLLRCLQVAALKLALAQMMEANKTAMTEQASRVDAAAELSNQAQQDLALLASEHRSAQVALIKGLSDEVESTATATATALEETRSSVTGWAATMLAGLDDSAQQVESFVSAQQAALASIVAQVRPGSRCFYVRVSDPCACVRRALMHVHVHTRRWRQTPEPARVRWQRIVRPWMPLSVCVCVNTLVGACLHIHPHKHFSPLMLSSSHRGASRGLHCDEGIVDERLRGDDGCGIRQAPAVHVWQGERGLRVSGGNGRGHHMLAGGDLFSFVGVGSGICLCVCACACACDMLICVWVCVPVCMTQTRTGGEDAGSGGRGAGARAAR